MRSRIVSLGRADLRYTLFRALPRKEFHKKVKPNQWLPAAVLGQSPSPLVGITAALCFFLIYPALTFREPVQATKLPMKKC